MRVLLTSYREAAAFDGDARIGVYSAANWQPRGLTYPNADWAIPRTSDGKRIYISTYGGPSNYWPAMVDFFEAQSHTIAEWLNDLDTEYFVLACWCPYTRKAGEQLRDHGSFVCHTGPLGEVLSTFPGLEVVLDTDRLERMWTPLAQDA